MRLVGRAWGGAGCLGAGRPLQWDDESLIFSADRVLAMFTVTASCLKPLLAPPRGAKPKLDLMEVPRFARDILGVHGINLTTDLLAGMPKDRIEQLRDRADKARCACLMLIEHEPQKLGAANDAEALGAVERIRRVIRAANVLGCNAAAVKVVAADDEAALQRTGERFKECIKGLEKLDVNVLISPGPGLCSSPERIAELLKKVGGFRMGTFPDFQTAAAAKDPVAYLRRLAPYATVVSCSTVEFAPDKPDKPEKASKAAAAAAAAALADPSGEPVMKHVTYELKPLLDAITAVGFQGTLALDYRGKGDPTQGLIWSRKALERVMADDSVSADDEELLDDFEDEAGNEVEEPIDEQ